MRREVDEGGTRPRGVLIAAGLAVLSALTLPPTGAAGPATAGAAIQGIGSESAAQRPNIVVIMTDDQAVGDLRAMPLTRRLLGRQGVTFDGAISSNPLCCPARATLLTGQGSHNNNVWTNDGRHGGYDALGRDSRLPQWLRRAGYHTGMIGKHLNGYLPSDDGRDPGWDFFDPTIDGVYSYTHFTQFANGHPTVHRSGYITDYVAATTVRALDAFERDDGAPFFLWASYVAPHRSDRGCAPADPACWWYPIPAARFATRFAAARPPSLDKASYNERSMADKIWAYRELPRVATRQVVREHRERLRTLLSVDRAVARTVRALARRGELERTLIIFTSDNGYVMGEHRWIGKILPFEESLRVPLVIRGPGVAHDLIAHQLVTTADLTATIVEAAGSGHSHPLDGISLLPYLGDPTAPDDRPGALIQSGGFGFAFPLGTWMYRGYRDGRYTYARYRGGAEELYDRALDPLELTNVATRPAYSAVVLAARAYTGTLLDCVGAECRQVFPALPPPTTLAARPLRGTRIVEGVPFHRVPYVP